MFQGTPSVSSKSEAEVVFTRMACSTGSAGLIQTIQMFVAHHWAAAILSLVATVGWVIQGVGNAFYYRQVCRILACHEILRCSLFIDIFTPYSRGAHHGKGL